MSFTALSRLTPVALVLSAALGGAAQAQCPDGTPPPCRAAAPVTRRANPPLDERTWIVVPFENISRAPDIDWLRDASVNLLYLDLSRWQDIRVIDDERVADLMREVPAPRAGSQQVSLQTALGMARRAGAGKLVMGDLLKVGNRTQVVAKVFDVRNGQRLRSVREETSNPDSLMAVFGRLARGILDVPPPPGAALGTTGTVSLQAYRSYLAGVRALSGWDLEGARSRFREALESDSTFALAHYKLSIVYGWIDPTIRDRRAHAEAASRHASALPARERVLIAGQLAQANGRWGEACERYSSLLRADSGDVEAWYNLGECNFHDEQVAPASGDSTRMVFRGDWNLAARAFRRTLELDPTYHLALQHIPDMLEAPARGGCRGTPCSAQNNYLAAVLREGDSLLTTPVRATEGQELGRQFLEASRTNSRYLNLVQARRVAQEWVAAGPNEPRARRTLAHLMLRTGDLAGAERMYAQVAPAQATRIELPEIWLDRVELLLKLDRAPEALALADSFAAAADSLGQRNLTAVLGMPFGRFRRAGEILGRQTPAAMRPFIPVIIRAVAGFSDDSLALAESTAVAIIPQALLVSQLQPLAVWGVRHTRRHLFLPLDTGSADQRMRLASLVLSGDTARARRFLVPFDSTLLARPAEVTEDGSLLLSSEVHLVLGDTAAALDRLLEFERRWVYQPLVEVVGPGGMPTSLLWGRTWLLMGDLAAALGRRDIALRGYRRVTGMWSGADPELQPAVQRVRARLETLGAAPQ
jgi:tetratricopeptide (TPR) repeat protein/TolB-like protein